MNILFLVPEPSMNGGSRVISIYAQYLAARGNDVTLVYRRRTLRWKLKAIVKKFINFEFSELLKVTSDTYYSHYRDLSGVTLKAISEKKENFSSESYRGYDAYIATWWETAYWLNEVSAEDRKKFYFLQHLESVIDFCPADKVNATFNFPLHKFSVASWISEEVQRLGNQSYIPVISNAVDHSRFYVPPGALPKPKVFCSMYSPSNFKRASLTISLLEELHKEDELVRLVLFSGEPLPMSMKLPDWIDIFVRPSPEVLREIYSTSCGYIFSSDQEGFGLTVLEALACGCPVVATRAGCVADYIEHEVNGYVADVNDIRGHFRNIKSLAQLDSESLSDMRSRAVNSVSEITWEACGEKLEKLIESYTS